MGDSPFTPQEIAAETARRQRENNPYPGRPGKRHPRRTSAQLDTSGGLPTCPKCGGTQFKARRTVGQRLKIGTIAVLTAPISAGVGGLAAAKGVRQKVQCITCGAFYERVR